jgi:hypothetical protein
MMKIVMEQQMMMRNKASNQAVNKKIGEMLDHFNMDSQTQILYQTAFAEGVRWADEHRYDKFE